MKSIRGNYLIGSETEKCGVLTVWNVVRIITVFKVHNIKVHKSNKRKANITCCCHMEDRVESIRGNYRIEVSTSSCKRSQNGKVRD